MRESVTTRSPVGHRDERTHSVGMYRAWIRSSAVAQPVEPGRNYRTRRVSWVTRRCVVIGITVAYERAASDLCAYRFTKRMYREQYARARTHARTHAEASVRALSSRSLLLSVGGRAAWARETAVRETEGSGTASNLNTFFGINHSSGVNRPPVEHLRGRVVGGGRERSRGEVAFVDF